MATSEKKGNAFRWLADVIGLSGGVPGIVEKVSQVWKAMPSTVQEQISQKMPGFMGLSKADERIFNPLLAKLTIEKQRIITVFLYTKCKSFQRHDFRNVVAGMEVVRGTPEIIEKIWDKDAKQFKDKVTSKKSDEDLRLMFLERFADYIDEYDPEEAYNACIATNMFAEHSLVQRVKNSFGAGEEEEVANQVNELIHGKSTFRSIFSAEGEEAAKQALRKALIERRRRKKL